MLLPKHECAAPSRERDWLDLTRPETACSDRTRPSFSGPFLLPILAVLRCDKLPSVSAFIADVKLAIWAGVVKAPITQSAARQPFPQR